MAKSMLYAMVAIAISLVGNAVAETPRWSAKTEQIGGTNHEVPVLEKIRRDSQTCKSVVVAFMQRPLAIDDNSGVLKTAASIFVRAKEATAVHVQIVAMDINNGSMSILDNFGFTGENGQKGRVLIESPEFIRKNYGQTLGVVTMSSECYERAKAATTNQLEGAIYSLFNNYFTDYKQVVKDGMHAGSDVGSKTGKVLGTAAGFANGWSMGSGSVGGELAGGALGTFGGGIGGGVAAIEQFVKNHKKWKSDRHNYLQYSDDKKQMSFPGFNCQVVPELFLQNCAGDSTVKVLMEYRQPGEEVVKSPDSADINLTSIDTSKLESLLKQQIEFVKSLLAKGERATEGEIETFNSRQKMMRQEVRRAFDDIKAISATDEEKKRIVETELAIAIKLVEQLHKLCNEAVSKKIIAELKSISFEELENSGKGQSGNKSDKCVCPNPDYKATIPPTGPGWATCTKCGKSLGTILNGRFISTNPAVNGKPVK